MRNEFSSTAADTAILPKSNAFLYSYNPRELIENDSAGNLKYLEQNRKENYLLFGDHQVLPNGLDNLFPQNFKKLLDKVYIGHGVKRTLINLLLSGGVGLYKEVKEGDRIIRDWQLDEEITDWLESFNFFTEYLTEAATDMVYVENNFPLIYLNKGARIGRSPKIAKIELFQSEDMRIDYTGTSRHNQVFYGDWYYSGLTYSDIKPFPMFDRANPFKNPVSAMFLKMATFASTGYGRPPDIGAVQMLEVLALLPNFHRANLTEKGFKWIISVSQDLYDAVCKENNWARTSKEFADWKGKFTQKIDDFLTAPDGDKVQTRFLTEFAVDKHTMKPIDAVQITKLADDTKLLSEVGLSLHDTYTLGYVSASSINPQLANVHLKNHALSGSNMKEAYDMHIQTYTPILRNLILHPINTALRINFPDKKLKAGFMDIAFDDTSKKPAVKQETKPVADNKQLINDNQTTANDIQQK